jgi:hypothetical protein
MGKLLAHGMGSFGVYRSYVVARRTAKNSLEKPISLEKARRGRLHKYWPFLSTLGQGPRVDNALKISGPILTRKGMWNEGNSR